MYDPISESKIMAARIAGLRAELALKRIALLMRSYDPAQLRDWHGRWTATGQSERPDASTKPQSANEPRAPRILLAGGFSGDDLQKTVGDFVAQNCEGRIHRELPGQFYGLKLIDVQKLAQSGNSAARKCLKLLNRDSYRK